LSFLLFSTYQLQGIRPDLRVRTPVVTSNRLERFRLQGFVGPSWRFWFLGAYVVIFHTTSAHKVSASAFQSRERIRPFSQIAPPLMLLRYPSAVAFWATLWISATSEACSSFRAFSLCRVISLVRRKCTLLRCDPYGIVFPASKPASRFSSSSAICFLPFNVQETVALEF